MTNPPETGPLPRPAPKLNPAPASSARVVLVGPPAAGKSTIGRVLADRLGVPLSDTDNQIAERHGSIGDIFATKGEARFRELEREAVRRALRRLLVRPGVVSLGGGAVLNQGTRAQLKHPGLTVVFIEIDEDTVAQRLRGGHRPLLADPAAALENWKALVSARQPLYDDVANIRVSASNDPPSTIVNRIVDSLVGLARAEEYSKYLLGEDDSDASISAEGIHEL